MRRGRGPCDSGGRLAFGSAVIKRLLPPAKTYVGWTGVDVGLEMVGTEVLCAYHAASDVSVGWVGAGFDAAASEGHFEVSWEVVERWDKQTGGQCLLCEEESRRVPRGPTPTAAGGRFQE